MFITKCPNYNRNNFVLNVYYENRYTVLSKSRSFTSLISLFSIDVLLINSRKIQQDFCLADQGQIHYRAITMAHLILYDKTDIHYTNGIYYQLCKFTQWKSNSNSLLMHTSVCLQLFLFHWFIGINIVNHAL